MSYSGQPQDVTPDAVHQRALKCLSRGRDAEQINDTAAMDALAFRAGEQWDQKIARDREQEGRPTLTFNRTGGFVRQVSGEIRRARPGIRVAPGDGAATPQAAEIYEGLIRAIERASSAQRVYSTAIDQAATCGKGHCQLVLDYADPTSFDLEISIASILNPFAVVWDPAAVKPCRGDAKWCMVTEEIDKDAYEARFPGKSVAGLGDQQRISDFATHWKTGDLITVGVYWEMREVPARLLLIRHWSGVETTQLDPTPDEILRASFDGWQIVAERRTVRRKVVSTVLSAHGVLEETREHPFTRIPVFTCWGEEVYVGSRVVRSGLIQPIMDAQRMLNYARSSDVETYGMMPKAPYVLAAEQIAGREDQWLGANRSPTSALVYNFVPGLAPPMRQQAISTSPALLQMAREASDEMKAGTGIYDASLGNRGNETSGRAIEAREAQADVGTYVYVDNLQAMIEAIGREIVALVPKIYSTRRQIRILGQDDAPAIIDLAEQGIDLNIGRYDVVVQSGPGFQTRRQEAARGMTDLASRVPPQFAVALIPRIAKMQDWEDADLIGDEFRQIAQASGLMPPLPQPGMPPGMPLGPPGAPPGMPPQGMAPPMPPGFPFPPGAPPGAPGFPFPPGRAPAAPGSVRPRPPVAGPAGLGA